MITLKIKKSPKAKLPVYKSSGAAGADIFSLLDYPMKIKPGEISLIPTGISIEIPEGFEAQIRPRSGLALKYGITIANILTIHFYIYQKFAFLLVFEYEILTLFEELLLLFFLDCQVEAHK